MGHDVIVVHVMARDELDLPGGGAAEFVDLETARALGTHRLIVERRERALRRKRRPGDGARQELLRSRRHHALRHERGELRSLDRFDGESEPGAHEAPLVRQIVVARVARAVVELEPGPNAPAIEREHLGRVAAAVAHRRERDRIAALVILRAVRQPDVVGVRPSGPGHERARDDPRGEISFAHRRAHGPVAGRRRRAQ